jgi:hypothetical protein
MNKPLYNSSKKKTKAVPISSGFYHAFPLSSCILLI